MAGDVDIVFDSDRHAAKRQINVGIFGLFESVLDVHAHVGVNFRLSGLDTFKEGFDGFLRGELFGG